MGGEWKEGQLGQFVNLRRGHDLPSHERKEGGIPIISSSGISDFHNQSISEGPGVITGRYGTIGQVFYSEGPYWPLNTTLYVDDFKGNDPKFVYYFLKTINYSKFSEKSAVPGINRNDLHLEVIEWPENIDEQRAIAHILGTLDDKIALNRKMNATLEAMAQALFQSWFVDFDPVIDKALAAGHEIPEPFAAKARRRAALGDRRKPLPAHIAALFPDRFVETEEMGWVPEGWEVKDIGSVVDRITVPRRYAKDEVFPSGKVPVLEQGSSIYMGYHNNNPDVTASIDAPAVVFGDHTCILELMIEPFSISSNVITFRGKNCATTWVYYAIIGKQASEEYRRHWSEFIIKKVILPSQELAEVFPQQLKVLIGKITQLRRQANTLTTLRDTLLPKLISGELRLPDATLQSVLP